MQRDRSATRWSTAATGSSAGSARAAWPTSTAAEDTQLGRRVALKLLYRRFAEDAEFVERFRREASSAAGLQHPNVVQVFDRGEWDGTYYIAMELPRGPHRSSRSCASTGALEPALAVDLVAADPQGRALRPPARRSSTATSSPTT